MTEIMGGPMDAPASLDELRDRLTIATVALCEDCLMDDDGQDPEEVAATWVAVEYYPAAGTPDQGGWCDTFLCHGCAFKSMARERGDKDYDSGWWYVSFTGIAQYRRELRRAIKQLEAASELP